MTKEEGKIKVDGLVIEALPGTQFRVRLDNGHEVLAYLSGKMRKHYIRILLGDRVALDFSIQPRHDSRVFEFDCDHRLVSRLE